MIRSIYETIVPEEMRDRVYQLLAPEVFMVRKQLTYALDRNARESSRRLSGLKGIYSGKRCFLMGNGPSLNKMDLNLLDGEYVWGSNKCYLLFDRVNWRPAFYVAVDRRVVPDVRIEIAQLTRDFPGTIFFFPLFFRVTNVLGSNPNVYWYEEKVNHQGHLASRAFSTQVDKWVSRVRTVTVAMLQLAVYLGFNPIYLIGCDTSYSIPSTVQKVDKNGDLLVSTSNDDVNHFSSEYFGKGSKWHDPHVENMIQHYQKAKVVCDSLNVQVYNATVGGNLEVFPRKDYKTLFLNSDQMDGHSPK
jgi:hypothetical protein